MPQDSDLLPDPIREPSQGDLDGVSDEARKDYGGVMINSSVSIYCICGASLNITAARHVVDTAVALWLQEHRGLGHGLCTEIECDISRDMAESRAIREGAD